MSGPVHGARAEDPSGTAAAVGPRLRAARSARRLSLEEVARTAGVTKGYLSKLERGQVGASVAVLVRLCEALDVAPGTLFEPAAPGEVLRAGDYPPLDFGGTGLREHLLTPRGEARLAVILSDIDADGGGGDEPYALPADVEVALVLEGSLELRFPDSGGPVRLGAGDVLTFDPGERHTFTAGPDGARVLWVITPGMLTTRSASGSPVDLRQRRHPRPG
ncbi:helix-turn-helix domain-containing protein [Quadrisphaera oryzae]|uniref:helix-turn-helix domain-containing protein n=1 Tax=Quadrisphaera TaxID=317661 RepID=UPI0016497116|nr:helix-turn-helix transcriptional regulator [Quadrisphaera sp. RL12-1S]